MDPEGKTFTYKTAESTLKKNFFLKGRSPRKKTVKKGDIVRTGRGGVNPSSFFKPKFTRFSNHSEMDF